MARDFTDTSSQFLNRDADTPISAYPFSLSVRVNPKNTASTETLFCLGSDKSASGSGFVWMLMGNPSRARLQTKDDVGGIATDNSADNSLNQNAWNIVSASWEGATDRRLYTNGTKTTYTASITLPTQIVYTAIGTKRIDSTPANFNFLDGRVGEAAIWNVTLGDAEHAILAAGFSPLFVRPQSLVRYYPIIGRTSPEIELMGGFDLTVTGAVASEHPPIILPARAAVVMIPAAAAGGGSIFGGMVIR